MIRAISLALGAASLVAAPAFAAPTAASSLSIEPTRAAAPTGNESDLVGGGTYALVAFLAFVAAVVVIKEATDSDSN